MARQFFLKNPLRILRPEVTRDPRNLAQEIYAMFSEKGPVQIDDTVTISVPHDRPALRIERRQPTPENVNADFSRPVKGGSTRQTAADVPRRRASQEVASRRTIATANEDVRRDSEPLPGRAVTPGKARQPSAPLVEIAGGVRFSGGEAIQFDTPPTVFDPLTQTYRPLGGRNFNLLPLDSIDEGGVVSSGKAGTLFGKVQSGYGDTCQVILYPDGPGGSPGKTVTVNIPFIAEFEAMTAGTWLTGIQKFKDGYWCQPPVWMP